MLSITPTGHACGAVVTGVDLSKPLNTTAIAAVRSAWLKHHVLVFPDQKLTPDNFERVATTFGPIADDPFISPIEGHERIAAIQRRADETGQIFADVWHSDWSFKPQPPAGTLLYGITIPPTGGDTLFVNEHKALDEMPAALREKLQGKIGVHSAGRSYAKDGKYSEANYKGSMQIKTSDAAKATFGHPVVRRHPETNAFGLFAGSYLQGIEGLPDDESSELVDAVRDWLTQPEFIYTHKWQKNMLVIWDNRSVLHKATGGFEGHARLLHRLTVEDDPQYYIQ